jgi:hypothetical protein
MLRQVVDRIIINRERRKAECYLLVVPRAIAQSAAEFRKTHISVVPPTGFEPVLQA